jgi:hypothetical protein
VFPIPRSVDDKYVDASSLFCAASLTLTEKCLSRHTSPQFHPSAICDFHRTTAKETNMRAKISRGLRSLPPKTDISTQEEYDRMIQETADIEQWWSNTHRWGHTKRPFTGVLHKREEAYRYSVPGLR